MTAGLPSRGRPEREDRVLDFVGQIIQGWSYLSEMWALHIPLGCDGGEGTFDWFGELWVWSPFVTVVLNLCGNCGFACNHSNLSFSSLKLWSTHPVRMSLPGNSPQGCPGDREGTCMLQGQEPLGMRGFRAADFIPEERGTFQP